MFFLIYCNNSITPINEVIEYLNEAQNLNFSTNVDSCKMEPGDSTLFD